MQIIALSGKRGVGKSALAAYFCKNYGFIKISFAEDLRRIARGLFQFTEADFDNPLKKEAKFDGHDWTPREFLIHLGEFMRFHEADYWIKTALRRLSSESSRYVIDDMRFRNEADMLRSMGATLVRIERYAHDNPYGEDLDIESEKALDNYVPFHYVIPKPRNLTLAELHAHAKHILEVEVS